MVRRKSAGASPQQRPGSTRPQGGDSAAEPRSAESVLDGLIDRMIAPLRGLDGDPDTQRAGSAAPRRFARSHLPVHRVEPKGPDDEHHPGDRKHP